MPMYEYHCRECGKDFEELVVSNSADNPSCPSCQSPNTEKKMSVFGSIGGSTSKGGSCGTSGFS